MPSRSLPSLPLPPSYKSRIAALPSPPHLTIIAPTQSQATKTYLKAKQTLAQKIGIITKILTPQTPAALSEAIRAENKEQRTTGIIIQLPLAREFGDAKQYLEAVEKKKDVDAIGHVHKERIPCTPRGIMELIKSTGVKLEGKIGVVMGRSRIVGKPVADLLLRHDMTTVIVHAKSQNAIPLIKLADVIVVAVGKADTLRKDMVKPGAIVIDVGINRTPVGKLVGDVASDVADVAGWLTPVPGGVGPMTVQMLMLNVIEAAEAEYQQTNQDVRELDR